MGRAGRRFRWAAAFAFAAALITPASSSAEPSRRQDAKPASARAGGEERVFDRWLRSSTEVAAWRTRVGSARFDVLTAKLLPNPEISLGGTLLVTGTPPDGKAGVEAQVSVPLPIFGHLGARQREAEAKVSVTEVTVLVMLWERWAELQSAMVEVAFEDARAKMLVQNLSELERLRGIVEARVRAGGHSVYDLLRVTTSETTARAALSNAETSRMQAEAKLVGLMAESSLTRLPVTREDLIAFRGPEDEASLVKLALERRPDLELSRRNVTASTREAERWRKEATPIPSVFAGAYAVHGAFGVQVTGGLSMPLPIFDRHQGQVGRALSEAHESELLGQTLETRIKTEVTGAWQARQAASSALDEYRRVAIPAVNELLRRAEVTYQSAQFSIAELFDAYRTMWDARLQELELERQKAVAETMLEKAVVLFPLEVTKR